MRKKEKRIMKSVKAPPYEKFQNFYPLDQLLDVYMEIWYKDDSSDSSD